MRFRRQCFIVTVYCTDCYGERWAFGNKDEGSVSHSPLYRLFTIQVAKDIERTGCGQRHVGIGTVKACGERCGERLCFTASRCLSARWKPVKAWRQIQSFLTYELKRLQSTRLQGRNALPDKVPFWRGLIQTPCLPVNLLLANCNLNYILIGVICKVHVSPAWRGTWRTQTSTLAG